MSELDVEMPAVIPPPSAGAAASGAGDHRREREKRLRLGILTSLLTKPLAVLVPFVLFPLFLRYLGLEGNGLYEAIGALAMWFALTNAGLGLGLVNRLADCNVSGDAVLARRYVSSLFVAMLAISAISILGFSIIAPWVRWSVFFPAQDPSLARQVPWAVWTATSLTLLSICASLPTAVYQGYQETHRNNYWDAVARVVSLAACFIVTYTRWGLVGAILASSGVSLLVRFVNVFTLFAWEKPILRPHPRLFDLRLLKRVLSEGICFFVLQMAVMAIFQTDKLIISARLGPEHVNAYAAVGRLFVSGYGLFILVLAPLWAAHAEALRRQDFSWVRRGLRNSLLFGCGTMLFGGIVLFFFGNFILRIWTRNDQVEVSRSLVVALTLMFALRAWVDSRSVVLNSAGVLVPQMFFFGTHAVLNLVIAIIVAPRYGVEGIAWSTVVTSLCTSAWGYPLLMRRYVWQRPTGATLSTADALTRP
jgi:O-antigen/teichoic acid export membrane protein